MDVSDLKKGLSQSLRTDGTLDILKAQLRAQVLGKLKAKLKPSVETKETPPSALDVLCDSLVANYLSESGRNHCLSVFLPESCGGKGMLPHS